VIRLGTRGSALALAQARMVAERLPGEVEIVPIRTSGDESPRLKGSDPLSVRDSRGLTPAPRRLPYDRSRPDPDPSDKSRFVKEIEEALLAGEIDVAVHSAKDLPTDFPRGLLLLHAVLERADPRDAICGADSLEDLPEGAVVGTSSLRRRAELLALRPDLDVRDIRGNVDTRLRRLADGDFDALVLAQAGLDRLGRGGEGRPLDPEVFVPAPGQGCLAVQLRDADEPASKATFGLTDFATDVRLREERCVVRSLRATCNTPIGVHAAGTPDDTLRLTAFIGLPDGSRWIRDELELPWGDAAGRIGLDVAARLRRAGADELLAEAERAVAAG
jgi:hydroxymethylbilane synthase